MMFKDIYEYPKKVLNIFSDRFILKSKIKIL